MKEIEQTKERINKGELFYPGLALGISLDRLNQIAKLRGFSSFPSYAEILDSFIFFNQEEQSLIIQSQERTLISHKKELKQMKSRLKDLHGEGSDYPYPSLREYLKTDIERQEALIQGVWWRLEMFKGNGYWEIYGKQEDHGKDVMPLSLKLMFN